VQRELLAGARRVPASSRYGAARGGSSTRAVHEAVAQQPFEGRAAGEIVEVYQPGYRPGGGLIRPARVLVAG
jgi:hypothetical protein